MTTKQKILLAAIIPLLLLLVLWLPVKEWALVAYDWALINPGQSMVAFVGVFVLAVVLAMPASLFVIIAGFLFGLLPGLGLVVLGSLIGSTAAFLLARNLMRTSIEKKIGSNTKLRAIDRAINTSGLFVVILTRLSMVIPYNLLNFAFGLTSVGIKDYVLGTTIGMVLPQLLFVFLGTTAKDIASIVNGDVSLEGQTWTIGVVGTLLVVATVAIITAKAKQALQVVLDEEKELV